MTRFVVDVGTLLHLAGTDATVSSEHELLAPTLIRSQILSALHEAVHEGRLDRDIAKKRLDYFRALNMRLLGDAVLRDVAWKIADELGWPSTYDAEYLALTRLQADAFVTTDLDLAERAAKIVRVAAVDELI